MTTSVKVDSMNVSLPCLVDINIDMRTIRHMTDEERRQWFKEYYWPLIEALLEEGKLLEPKRTAKQS